MGPPIAANLGSAISTAKTREDERQMLPSLVLWALADRKCVASIGLAISLGGKAHDRTRATWFVSQSQAESCVTAGSRW